MASRTGRLAGLHLCQGVGDVPRRGAFHHERIADRRLVQLNLQPIYRTEKNPLPWMDEMLNGIEHTNFFENRATEYSKASTRGTWDEAFD